MKIQKREFLAVILFSLFVLAAACVPYKITEKMTPPGMVFMGFIGANQDPNSYLSWVKQSEEGKWVFEDKYTTEKQWGIFIHPFFLITGKAAALFRIAPITAYELSGIISGFCLLMFLYGMCLAYFGTGAEDSNRRLVAFFLVTVSSGLSWVFPEKAMNFLETVYNIVPHDRWVVEGFTFSSIMLRPLFSVSQILLAGIFWLIWSGIEKNDKKYFAYAGVAGFFLVLIHPYDLITVYSALVVIAGLSSLHYHGKLNKSLLRVVVFSLPALIYEAVIFTHDPVFSRWSETLTLSPGPYAYIIGYGLLAFLGFWGGLLAWRRKKPADIILLSWVLAVLLLVYAPLNFQRRIVIGLQIPLGLFSAEAVFTGFLPFLKRFRIFRTSARQYAIVALVLILTLPSNFLYVKRAIDYAREFYLNYAVFDSDAGAFSWIDRNIRSSETILSSFIIGMYLPGRTGNKVYAGHWDQTIELGRKRQEIRMFYSGNASPEEAKEFLKTNNIRYVYFGPFEKMLGRFDPSKYPFLQPVYKIGTVTIYRLAQPD